MKVAVVVKYYPPLERVSGIIGFLTVFNRALGTSNDVHVITSRSSEAATDPLERDGYLIHQVRGPFPAAAAMKVRKLGAETALFVSGIHQTRFLGPYQAPFGALTPQKIQNVFLQATQVDAPPGPATQQSLRWADHILVAADKIADTFQPQFGSEIEVMAPAVDIPELSPREGPLTVGFVNHFNQVKGIGLAIEAIEAVLDADPSARAIIAGAGEQRTDVLDAFEDNPRVQVHGYVGEKCRLDLIANIDIMVLPFTTAVSVLGVSQTVLEVMAAGNVVVGTPSEAITAAVDHEINGLIAEPESFVGEVLRCAGDGELRQRLGGEARRNAISEWDIVDRVDQFQRLVGS